MYCIYLDIYIYNNVLYITMKNIRFFIIIAMAGQVPKLNCKSFSEQLFRLGHGEFARTWRGRCRPGLGSKLGIRISGIRFFFYKG